MSDTRGPPPAQPGILRRCCRKKSLCSSVHKNGQVKKETSMKKCVLVPLKPCKSPIQYNDKDDDTNAKSLELLLFFPCTTPWKMDTLIVPYCTCFHTITTTSSTAFPKTTIKSNYKNENNDDDRVPIPY